MKVKFSSVSKFAQFMSNPVVAELTARLAKAEALATKRGYEINGLKRDLKWAKEDCERLEAERASLLAQLEHRATPCSQLENRADNLHATNLQLSAELQRMKREHGHDISGVSAKMLASDPDQARELLAKNYGRNVIQQIKVVRELTGCCLKDGKEFIVNGVKLPA